MGKYDVDLMDGYDGKACVYDEKKEKRYHATIWICIMVCMILALIRGVTWHIEEVYITLNYQSMEAEYNEKSGYAYYSDANGKQQQCSMDGYDVKIKDGKVTLYYNEDMSEVRPVNTFWFWGKAYLFLGGLIAICIWRISKVYTKKSHSADAMAEA
ncbi:MAG: hypothetical protein IJX66_12925 [Lachnospiraceae bacterium]|nr:hypothetical protein [Lachnospiraceae bacterium]